jgi:hypothetical protein
MAQDRPDQAQSEAASYWAVAAEAQKVRWVILRTSGQRATPQCA